MLRRRETPQSCGDDDRLAERCHWCCQFHVRGGAVKKARRRDMLGLCTGVCISWDYDPGAHESMSCACTQEHLAHS